MKYYYIVYQATVGIGAVTLPHHKTENGFNIASGYEYLINIFGPYVVILSWQEISESQHLGFKKLMTELASQAKGSHLKPLQGGKSAPTVDGMPSPAKESKAVPPGVVLPFKPKDSTP